MCGRRLAGREGGGRGRVGGAAAGGKRGRDGGEGGREAGVGRGAELQKVSPALLLVCALHAITCSHSTDVSANWRAHATLREKYLN